MQFLELHGLWVQEPLLCNSQRDGKPRRREVTMLKNRTCISYASLFPPCGLSNFLWSSPTTRIQIDLTFSDDRQDSLLKSLPLIPMTDRLDCDRQP